VSTSTALLVLALLPLVAGLLAFLGALSANPESRAANSPSPL
jgi:hypothetical protein